MFFSFGLVGGTKGSSEQFAKHLDGEESRENNDSVGEVRKLGTRQGIFSQEFGPLFQQCLAGSGSSTDNFSAYDLGGSLLIFWFAEDISNSRKQVNVVSPPYY